MASVLLYLFIATAVWNSDMNCMVGAKVDSTKGNANISTSALKGLTYKVFNDMESYAFNSLLSELQLIQADEGIVSHHALWLRFKSGYTGIQATLNIFSLPGVGQRQRSSTSISLVKLDDSTQSRPSGIQAGWHVVPALYGDTEPHFYICSKLATSDDACYNQKCEGFVYVNSTVRFPGGKISPVSSYNGPQHEITISILQHQESGDWWVYLGKSQEVVVGYWPKSLFPEFANGANVAQYAGVVAYPKNELGPPMGSGHFPEEGIKKAAFMRDVMVRKNGEDFPSPVDLEDRDDCYRIKRQNNNWAYFGGPGAGCFN